MATMIQRSSHDNLLPTNSTEVATEPKGNDKKTEISPNMSLFAEVMNAWSQGRFNMPETVDEAIEAFYTKDVVYDVGSANAHASVPAFRAYSFDTLKDWFAYLATFDLTDVVVAAVPSSKYPSQVWQQVSCTATSKATGRSAYIELLNVIECEGDKIKRVTAMYADPAQHAYLNGVQEAPTAVKMPVFEPHPDPMPVRPLNAELRSVVGASESRPCPVQVYEENFAAWGAGEFGNAETKHAAFDKFVKTDFVLDASSAVLPEVFKVYRGHTGVDQWANGVVGAWEFTRMEVTAEVGLKPGCVMQRMEFDVKYAGKEAKGIVLYVEVAYDADGKGVYNKHFWANPKVAASLYAME